jgi:hypothetical protein
MTVVDAFYFTVETIATVGYDDFYVGSTPLLVARLTVAAGGGLDGLAMGDLVRAYPCGGDRPGGRGGPVGASAPARHPVPGR